MPLITEELSVWDIGMRWAGYDPDRFWLRLPLAARDYFRLLMEAILTGEIICGTLTLAKRPTGSKADPRFYIRTYIDAVYACIYGQQYSRKLLKWATLDRDGFHRWCERRGITPPEFWFPAGWKLEYDVERYGLPGLRVRHVEPDSPSMQVHFAYDSPYEEEDRQNGTSREEGQQEGTSGEQDNQNKPDQQLATLADQNQNEKALRDCQRIKLVCQQIAIVIWKEDKSRTIASLVKDELIQKYGGGCYYEDDTVREWLKKVAPVEVKNRRGRPRKNGGKEEPE